MVEHYKRNKSKGCGFKPTWSLETKRGNIPKDRILFSGSYNLIVALNFSRITRINSPNFFWIYSKEARGEEAFVYYHNWILLKSYPRFVTIIVRPCCCCHDLVQTQAANVAHLSMRSAQNTMSTRGTPEWHPGLVAPFVRGPSDPSVGEGPGR